MSDPAAVKAETARLLALFGAAGARPVETDLLLPADTLLDLYGEDIRARAYVTHDPDRGELMLRPDFTVPVVERHMAFGAEPARYTYAGDVFRMPPPGSGRAAASLQVGYEVFDRSDPMRADAEVFALVWEALTPLGLRAVTGDMGILLAAVELLSTTPRRRAALRRHVWRPRRFRALLDRFTGRSPAPAARAGLIAAVERRGAAAMIAEAGPEIGLRSSEEIAARIDALCEDANAPAIPATEAAAIDAVLSLKAGLPEVAERLGTFCRDLPGLAPAVDRLSARIAALAEAGIDVAALEFEASYGRTTMEYYDGFVFGFLAPDRADLPPVATGGRYDALTRVLGGGRAIPAVGGVIRPELVLGLASGGVA